MIVRESIEEDRDFLRQIYLETRRHAFYWLNTDSLTADDFDKDTVAERIWVSEESGLPTGFISVLEAQNFIHHLFVLPRFAASGHGSKLLETCMRHIGRPARLKCLVRNNRALTFYQSRGWYTVFKGQSADGEYYLMEASKR